MVTIRYPYKVEEIKCKVAELIKNDKKKEAKIFRASCNAIRNHKLFENCKDHHHITIFENKEELSSLKVFGPDGLFSTDDEYSFSFNYKIQKYFITKKEGISFVVINISINNALEESFVIPIVFLQNSPIGEALFDFITISHKWWEGKGKSIKSFGNKLFKEM
jgi:hypothetical protein